MDNEKQITCSDRCRQKLYRIKKAIRNNRKIAPITIELIDCKRGDEVYFRQQSFLTPSPGKTVNYLLGGKNCEWAIRLKWSK